MTLGESEQTTGRPRLASGEGCIGDGWAGKESKNGTESRPTKCDGTRDELDHHAVGEEEAQEGRNAEREEAVAQHAHDLEEGSGGEMALSERGENWFHLSTNEYPSISALFRLHWNDDMHACDRNHSVLERGKKTTKMQASRTHTHVRNRVQWKPRYKFLVPSKGPEAKRRYWKNWRCSKFFDIVEFFPGFQKRIWRNRVVANEAQRFET